MTSEANPGGVEDSTAPAAAETDEERLLRDQERILASISSARTRTVQERVAWILNRDPKARDSDIHLQLEYWKEFHSDRYDGGEVAPDDLYRLPRLTTLSRARAKIQNSYRLFQASPEVKANRRTLSTEERVRQLEDTPAPPIINVAGDESGKNGEYLIVGSVWALIAEQFTETMLAMREFKKSRKIKGEFHFVNINDRRLPEMMALVDEVIRPASALSFRAVAVKRSGLDVRAALKDLFQLMLLRGVDVEHRSRRAPLPRSLSFWKDLENDAEDRILLADLGERLRNASAARYDGQLRIEALSPIKSENSDFVQLADLFVSSLNRVMNENRGGSPHVKDEFARYLLDAAGMPNGPEQATDESGMALLIAL